MYGDELVNGSPLTFGVSKSGFVSKPDIRATGNGLEVCHRGKESNFLVYCPTTPNVQIERIDDVAEHIEPKIKSLNNNEWRISYTILTVGKYEIRASCPNRGPLPGSPWNIACVDSTKVFPIGGWGPILDVDGRLILPTRIVFDTHLGGPGELVCSVDGHELGIY